MQEGQTLIAEYARTGSESAFRELVTRYVGLVYGTALRLVGGDLHLAEDVTQTVFTDLARKARNLSSEVMLGGWLHQRTFNVAAPMMRAARRRESRERQAVQMNALQDHSAADLELVAPMLDEAITTLEKDDRTAIILRFFERRDFRSIGEALGSNENAARMRVNRALAKLQLILTRRGVTLSAAALGTTLSAEALTAAPAGLVASVAGHVLATSALLGPSSTTFLKIMAMTKLKTGAIAAVLLAGAATSLVFQTQARVKLRVQDDALRRQSEQLVQLVTDKERLSNLLAQANGSRDQVTDLPRLRAEAESLRKKTNTLASVREENLRLRQRAVADQTPLQIKEESIARTTFEKNWLLAFRIHANQNNDQFPASFDQAEAFLDAKFRAENNVRPDGFEIVYQGSTVMANPGQTIMLREKEPWLNSKGEQFKEYGMVDGSVQTLKLPFTWSEGDVSKSYTSFEAFEKDHIVVQPGK